MNERNHVLVYREALLPPSETFIRNELDSLRRWTPHLVGLDRVTSTLSRSTDTILLPEGATNRRRAFKVTRRHRDVTAAVRATDASVIHAHFGMDGTTILPTARRLGIPLITSFHGVDVNVLPFRNSLFGRLYRQRLPELFAYSSALITSSEFLRERLLDLGAAESKTTVLPFGVPFREPSSITERTGVLFVGRLTEVKGAEDALRAYAGLSSDIRAVHRLTIVGNGPDRGKLESLSDALGLDAAFSGMLPPEDVAVAMNRAAVLLGPSRRAPDGATEAFGMVFVEAALSGLPVVSYRSGGIPEAVLDGLTGMLVDEGDLPALTKALSDLLLSPLTRQAFGGAGRSRALAEFTLDEHARKLEEIYDRVIQPSATHGSGQSGVHS